MYFSARFKGKIVLPLLILYVIGFGLFGSTGGTVRAATSSHSPKLLGILNSASGNPSFNLHVGDALVLGVYYPSCDASCGNETWYAHNIPPHTISSFNPPVTTGSNPTTWTLQTLTSTPLGTYTVTVGAIGAIPLGSLNIDVHIVPVSVQNCFSSSTPVQICTKQIGNGTPATNLAHLLLQQAGSSCLASVLKYSRTFLGFFSQACFQHNFWTLQDAYFLAVCLVNTTCKPNLIADTHFTLPTTPEQVLPDTPNAVSSGDCFKNHIAAITCAKNLTDAGTDQLIQVMKLSSGFLCLGSVIATYLDFGTTFGFLEETCSTFAEVTAHELYDLTVCLDNSRCTERLVRTVAQLVGVGGNLWVTGHDADYHCSHGDPSSGASCHYLQVAVNFVTKKSHLAILVLDHGHEVETAIKNAFGSSAPTVIRVDPRTQFASLGPLLDSDGLPYYSAIIVASDITCGGCDNNELTSTPDTAAINARASEIARFFNSSGGVLALAGAEHRDVYYNFLPVTVTATTVTPPFSLTSIGQNIGLTNSDINCCQTHNSFQLPTLGSQLDVVETDSAGLAETMRVLGGFSGQ